MKGLSISVLVTVFAISAGQVFAASYQAGAATMTVPTGSCETRTISLDARDFGSSPLVSGGFLVTLSDITKAAITTCECYDGTLTPAVWDEGVNPVFDPIGYPGGLFVAAANLGAGVPVPAATILICDVEFCGEATGYSTITVQTVPDFDTWVAQDFTVYDPNIDPAVINVTITGTEKGCGNGVIEAGEDCDDGNVVDGDCCSSECTFEPVDSFCKDALYCNGDETCDGAGNCQAGTPVECTDDGLFCNGIESCDEATDSCKSSGDPCPSETPFCVESTDECQSVVPPITLHLTPESWYQSRWVPLIRFLTIQGTDSHFDRSVTEITFTPDRAVIMLPRVIDEATIKCIGFLMPRWWAPFDSIDVTVTTGTEVATEMIEIELLPFILDLEKKPFLEEF